MKVAPLFDPVLIRSQSDLAPVLAQLRTLSGLTCEEFCAHAGFADRYVNKLEHPDTPSGRKGLLMRDGSIKLSAMGEVWLEALGAELVLMPAALARQIGAKTLPRPLASSET